MSNKNIYMGKIKQILLQDKAGVSQRQIARNLGVNRETVGKYIKSAKADIMGVDGLLELDETELERRLNGGTAAYSDKRHDELALLLPGIEDEMRRGHRRGVTVKLLWEEYRREHPDGYGLTQFRHHYGQYLGAGKSVSTVLKDLHVPGQAVYLDFAGNRMHYVDPCSGEMVALRLRLRPGGPVAAQRGLRLRPLPSDGGARRRAGGAGSGQPEGRRGQERPT